MAADNDFLAWATGVGANVLTQALYAERAEVQSGVQAGIADPELYNKAQRQAAFVAAAMAQIIANNNVPAVDDGNVAAFAANFLAALRAEGVGRIPLLGATSFYVGGAGADDSNSGLTALLPWANPQHACDTLYNQYDLNGHTATVHLTGNGGNALTPFTLRGRATGQGQPYDGPAVVFDGGNAANTTVQALTANTNACQSVDGACLILRNCTIGASGTGNSNGIVTDLGGKVLLGGTVVFGACTHAAAWAYGAGCTIQTEGGAAVQWSGSGRFAIYASNLARWFLENASCTVSGSPTFSKAFASAIAGGLIDASGTPPVSGAAHGKRSITDGTSRIATNGGGGTFFPGDDTAGNDGAGNYYTNPWNFS